MICLYKLVCCPIGVSPVPQVYILFLNFLLFGGFFSFVKWQVLLG
uniref:Uncharacterized protein n=1 Tax=Anguilla anguilla TaxID=7936 RepID=A0A0E9U247_ANGAN